MRTCGEYEELISAFIDGALAEEDREALMEHMADCSACQQYFDDQIAIHDALERMEAPAPAGFAEQVMEKVRLTAQDRPEQPERKTVSFPRWRRWTALAACCAVVLLGVWAFGGRGGVENMAVSRSVAAQSAAADEAWPDAALGTPAPQMEDQEMDTAYDDSGAAVPEERCTMNSAPTMEADLEPEAGEDTCAQVYKTGLDRISVTIDRWQDEGFAATVTAGDSGGIFQTGDTLLVVFEEGTEVLLPDGGVFSYDWEEPNAPDCGLEQGEAVEILFISYELEPALRVYAVQVESEH